MVSGEVLRYSYSMSPEPCPKTYENVAYGMSESPLRNPNASFCFVSVWKSVRTVTTSKRASPKLVLPHPFLPTIMHLFTRPFRMYPEWNV